MGLSEDSVGSLEYPLETREVFVYTSSGCSRCKTLKEWLRSKKAIFEERNLADVDVMTSLVMKNVVVLSAPVLEIGGEFYTEDQIFDVKGLINTEILEILKGK